MGQKFPARASCCGGTGASHCPRVSPRHEQTCSTILLSRTPRKYVVIEWRVISRLACQYELLLVTFCILSFSLRFRATERHSVLKLPHRLESICGVGREPVSDGGYAEATSKQMTKKSRGLVYFFVCLVRLFGLSRSVHLRNWLGMSSVRIRAQAQHNAAQPESPCG